MKEGILSGRILAAWLLCSALLLSMWAAPTAAVEQRIGAVVERDYSGATALANGAADPRAIRYRDDVHALDTVETGDTGSTSLEFLDETRIDIGPGAEVRLDEFVYDPQSTVGGGEVSFAVGAFRYIGGRMTTEENMRLKTPTATMVIRGTELVIYVWPDGRTEVNVISGAVEVSACHGGGGGQLATAGMRIKVAPTCQTEVTQKRKIASSPAALRLPGITEDDGGEEKGRNDRDGGERSDRRGSNGGSGGDSGGGSTGGGRPSGGGPSGNGS